MAGEYVFLTLVYRGKMVRGYGGGYVFYCCLVKLLDIFCLRGRRENILKCAQG